MGNCFSEEVPGGMQAVGAGGIAGDGGGAADAVSLFLKSRGAPFSQIELSLSASDLRDRDALSKSDPMAVVYLKKRDGTLEEIGRTEVILNSLSPSWVAKINVNYQFEVVQTLVFRIYDVDSQFHNIPEKMLRLEEQQLLGEAMCLLPEVVTKVSKTLPLSVGTLTVHAEETFGSKILMEIVFRGCDLENKDLFSKSDPFLLISRVPEGGAPIPICKTEVRKNDLNPTWKPVVLNLQQIGSKESPLNIECFNFNSSGKHELIGKVVKSMAELEGLYNRHQGDHFFIPTGVGHEHHNKVSCASSSFRSKLKF